MFLFKKEQYLYDSIVLFLNKVGKYCCDLHLVTVSSLALLHDKSAGSLKFGVVVLYTINMHSQPARRLEEQAAPWNKVEGIMWHRRLKKPWKRKA